MSKNTRQLFRPRPPSIILRGASHSGTSGSPNLGGGTGKRAKWSTKEEEALREAWRELEGDKMKRIDVKAIKEYLRGGVCDKYSVPQIHSKIKVLKKSNNLSLPKSLSLKQEGYSPS